MKGGAADGRAAVRIAVVVRAREVKERGRRDVVTVAADGNRRGREGDR
jgi:hypothetical protein